MRAVARRLAFRWLCAPARRALLALCLLIGGAAPALACLPEAPQKGMAGRSAEALFSNMKPLFGKHENWAPRFIGLTLHAGYVHETDEYGHGVLGPLRDAKGLTISVRKVGDDRRTCPHGHWLAEGLVFEGIAPILTDLTNDGLPEIITTVSSAREGARVSVFDRYGAHVASTPFIGTRFRWLALIGADDLDGDGNVEIAYVDRPHLAKTLRVWRFKDGKLTEIATLPGLTNHKIGEDFISGGIRNCGLGPEIITADANWQNVIATTLSGGTLDSRRIGPFENTTSLEQALNCP